MEYTSLPSHQNPESEDGVNQVMLIHLLLAFSLQKYTSLPCDLSFFLTIEIAPNPQTQLTESLPIVDLYDVRAGPKMVGVASDLQMGAGLGLDLVEPAETGDLLETEVLASTWNGLY